MGYFDKITLSCTVYIVSCNFTIHATCLLTLMAYKYIEFQMPSAVQKLSCKASCETIYFFIMWREKHA
jgi:hypothetical protein